jgi:alkanesulfonate monooxygenase SsuD/methylene tetrahydromethanopterin reductase-like flavin-dependent oxidoreductase (luciferase family)
MRISLSLTQYSWPAALAPRLAAVARAADEAGLDTLWVPDHLIQADPTAVPGSEMLEAYTTLGFLAAHTRRIRIGAMVTAVTFRPATLLIKAVTTLDVLSGGRAWLGLGTGHHEAEARQMGLPFPPARERYEQLEKTLRLAGAMWRGDAASSPLPLSTPHPPILIGGMGERRTLRLVARYADACNLFDIPDEGATIRRKLGVLARHCEEAGRPYDAIEKTVSTRLNPGEPAEAFAERCAALAALGIEHAVVITPAPWTEETVAVLGAAARISART